MYFWDYELNNDRDFYRVIDIENGYWLETITSEELENTCPSRFSISAWHGKINFDIPITCFDVSENKVNYNIILKPNYDYSSDGWVSKKEYIEDKVKHKPISVIELLNKK